MGIRQEIGKRIRQSREALGWTQAELSQATDGALSASRIANYEQGTRLPEPEVFTLLGKALGVSPMWLIGFSPLRHELRNQEYVLIEYYRTMSARQQEDLIDRARRMMQADKALEAAANIVPIRKTPK